MSGPTRFEKFVTRSLTTILAARAAWAAGLVLVIALLLLRSVLATQEVSGAPLSHVLLLGALLGSVVPIVAETAAGRQDARTLAKLGMVCRAELSLAMGVIAGLALVAAAAATDEAPAAVTVVLAAAAGAAGALRVARALVARADTVLTFKDEAGETAKVTLTGGAVDAEVAGVQIKKVPTS